MPRGRRKQARAAASTNQKPTINFFGFAAAKPKATHCQITGQMEPCCRSLISSSSSKSTSVTEQ